jgi:hypothetical protein
MTVVVSNCLNSMRPRCCLNIIWAMCRTRICLALTLLTLTMRLLRLRAHLQLPRRSSGPLRVSLGGWRWHTNSCPRRGHEHVKILYTVSNPCWDWYTDQVKSVKTPADGLRYSVQFAAGRWAKEPHLWQTIKHSLCDEQSLSFAGLYGSCINSGCEQVAIASNCIQHARSLDFSMCGTLI